MVNREQTFAALIPLLTAMREDRPVCLGDRRFTDDRLRISDDAEEFADMAEACASCPLLDACREFAVMARPEAGFWAGRWRGGDPRPLRRNGGEAL